MRYLILFKAIFIKRFIELMRYPVSLVTMLISLYLIFFFIFFGIKTAAKGGNGFDNTLEGIIIGFALWTLSILAYSGLSQTLVQEAYQGTLEQLYMTPLGFGWVSISTIISSLTFSLLVTGAILLLMMGTTGKYLSLSPVVLLFLLFVIAPVYGIGFVVGGLTLIFKQIEPLTQLFQYAFIALIVLPVERHPLLKLFPLALGNNIIRKMVSEGFSLSQISLGDILLLIFTGAFYLSAGWVIFKLCEKVAKDKGLLAHY